MQIRATVGGADTTNIVGAAIQDSNYPGLPASQAFDDNINTLWACNGTGTASWLGWDYGATSGNWVDAAQFALTTRNDGSWGQNANSISFQYSDDGSTWTEAFQGSPTWTGAGQTILFVPPAPVTGLDIAKVEDVPWLDPKAGLSVAKQEDVAWLDPKAGLDISKLEHVAWLDIDGLHVSKIEDVPWLDPRAGLSAAEIEFVAWLDPPPPVPPGLLRRRQLNIVN